METKHPNDRPNFEFCSELVTPHRVAALVEQLLAFVGPVDGQTESILRRFMGAPDRTYYPVVFNLVIQILAARKATFELKMENEEFSFRINRPGFNWSIWRSSPYENSPAYPAILAVLAYFEDEVCVNSL